MKITFVVSDYCPKNVTKKGLNKLVDDLLKYMDSKVQCIIELGTAEIDRHQWSYFFERIAHKKEFMTFQSFNSKVSIVMPPETQFLVGEIMYDAFNHFRVNVWRYAFFTAILASMIVVGLFVFSEFRKADPAEIIYQKIMYLVSKDKTIGDLNSYYRAKKLNATNEMRILSREIAEACEQSGEDHDIIIGMIHHESDFKKYARSNIRIYDRNGHLARIDHAYGYMQIYGQAWADVFAITEDESKPECIYKPSYNLACGIYIYQFFKKRAGNNLLRTLIYYNGGRAKPLNDQYTVLQTESYRYIEDVMQSISVLKNVFGKANDQKI